MRAIGIDPGTVTIDLCGIDDAGCVFLDRSWPTRDVLAEPAIIVDAIEGAGPVDLIAGPSGYGLPLRLVRDLTDADFRLAFLAAPGEQGGIGGLRGLIRALARLPSPVVLTPGVVHLPTVPAHRKVNRVDMGTADKVCAAALALAREAARRGCAERDVSFILLELGGAFSAALAVERGRIVDGVGGSSGPLGLRAAGALDGEVAFLAGTVTKPLIFGGGASAVAGAPDLSPGALAAGIGGPRAALARSAYVESAVKAIAALRASAPDARRVVLSGRAASAPGMRGALAARLAAVLPDVEIDASAGFAAVSSEAAQGAALIADGLAGGRSAALVEALELRRASGTVLDHLYVIDQAAARARLGIE